MDYLFEMEKLSAPSIRERNRSRDRRRDSRDYSISPLRVPYVPPTSTPTSSAAVPEAHSEPKLDKVDKEKKKRSRKRRHHSSDSSDDSRSRSPFPGDSDSSTAQEIIYVDNGKRFKNAVAAQYEKMKLEPIKINLGSLKKVISEDTTDLKKFISDFNHADLKTVYVDNGKNLKNTVAAQYGKMKLEPIKINLGSLRKVISEDTTDLKKFISDFCNQELNKNSTKKFKSFDQLKMRTVDEKEYGVSELWINHLHKFTTEAIFEDWIHRFCLKIFC
ncbi:hypothetical protein CAEBREN_13727 [Caenorhabditis brenneri]|uniref:Uncharacterized protein n=1 Tax=Caenorhabditis brenneri TaxID=135651 RepID=G0NNU3_CAEBE|nr:hypothetical protein CAEBREN_13727 [Caenorhabditis brenneri]